MYTLNNISNLFQAFATNHKNLKGSYYFGIAGEHESRQGDKNYPLMVAELETSTVGEKLDSYQFKMWFLSQHRHYEGRDIEMLSDLKQIATDFLIFLRQTKFEDNKTFTIDTSATLTDFHHSFNDDCAGWYLTINCKQFLDWDKCAIPMTGYTPPPNNNNVKVYDQDNNLLYTLYPGQTLTVEVLQEIIQTLDAAPVTIIQTLT